jgi:DNA-binding NarL/FixJ family response regulator
LSADRSAAIAVLVVDDHPGVLSGLAALVRSASDLALLGSACGGEEAVRLSAQLSPQVVVTDLAMPGMNGVEATKRLLRLSPAPAVIALSASHELIADAATAGAAFTMLKDVEPRRLLEVIRAAAVGLRCGLLNDPRACSARMSSCRCRPVVAEIESD